MPEKMDIREEKRLVEDGVRELLNNFQEVTGLYIANIDFTYDRSVCGVRNIASVSARMELE